MASVLPHRITGCGEAIAVYERLVEQYRRPNREEGKAATLSMLCSVLNCEAGGRADEIVARAGCLDAESSKQNYVVELPFHYKKQEPNALMRFQCPVVEFILTRSLRLAATYCPLTQ